MSYDVLVVCMTMALLRILLCIATAQDSSDSKDQSSEEENLFQILVHYKRKFVLS